MNQVWEGEAYVDGVGRVRFLDPQTGELSNPVNAVDEELTGEMFYPALAAGKGSVYGLQGRRVCVTITTE